MSEALRLAAWLNGGAWHAMRLGDVEAAGRELRRLAAEVENLRSALSFYADESRYHGPNQPLDAPDKWSEKAGLNAFRLDVTRDQGVIARNALENPHG